MHKIIKWFPITFRINCKFVTLAPNALSDYESCRPLQPHLLLSHRYTLGAPNHLHCPQNVPSLHTSTTLPKFSLINFPISFPCQRLNSRLLPLEGLPGPHHF